MTRRSFFQRLGIGLAVAVLAPTTLLTGCAFSVTGMLDTIISAIQGILKVATGASWATDLTNALSALQQAAASWISGGAVAIVEDALNTLESMLAVIPTTAVYSALVAIIVTGIESILNFFSPPATALVKPRATVATNPYLGQVTLNKPSFAHPTYQGAFKAQYNEKAKALGLTKAEIA